MGFLTSPAGRRDRILFFPIGCLHEHGSALGLGKEDLLFTGVRPLNVFFRAGSKKKCGENVPQKIVSGLTPLPGLLARIEVEREWISRLAEPETARLIADKLKSLGFHHVALDLSGYRMGSLNEDLT